VKLGAALLFAGPVATHHRCWLPSTWSSSVAITQCENPHIPPLLDVLFSDCNSYSIVHEPVNFDEVSTWSHWCPSLATTAWPVVMHAPRNQQFGLSIPLIHRCIIYLCTLL
jgi:hypothetical protein